MNQEQEQIIRRSDVNLAELRADAARSVNSELVAELVAERALSDTLARALQNYANLDCFEVDPNPESFVGQTRAALARYDASRAK